MTEWRDIPLSPALFKENGMTDHRAELHRLYAVDAACVALEGVLDCDDVQLPQAEAATLADALEILHKVAA